MEQNNKKTWLIVAVLAVLLVILAVLLTSNRDNEATNTLNNDNQETVINTTNDQEIITPILDIEYTSTDQQNFESFLMENISIISPEKEVLGGTFYITNIEWLNFNEGIVDYEDGHIALKAAFGLTYSDETRVMPEFSYFNLIPLDPLPETMEESVEEPIMEEPVIEEPIIEPVVEGPVME